MSEWCVPRVRAKVDHIWCGRVIHVRTTTKFEVSTRKVVCSRNKRRVIYRVGSDHDELSRGHCGRVRRKREHLHSPDAQCVVIHALVERAWKIRTVTAAGKATHKHLVGQCNRGIRVIV